MSILVHWIKDRTSEQGEAQITDPNIECQPYGYAPVTQVENQFPEMWTVANILANDNVAQARFNSMKSQIPNIPPKGTQPQSITGDFSNFAYPDSDPDCWWTYNLCTAPHRQGIPNDITIVPEPNTLGYAFDDGPYCGHNGFYNYLQSKRQLATMFYIGSNVMGWPLEAQRGLADGHEICVHTWSHHYMTALTNEQAFAELYYTIQIIKVVIGVTPTCWRPPYGDIDNRVRAIANAFGLRTVMWELDSNDWQGNPSQTDSNYQSLINAARSGTYKTAGTIFLTHELTNFTMSEAIKFHDNLASAFHFLVPVGVALNITHPYVEPGHTLPTFAAYASGTRTK